ncbi:MAG: L,D-transpeptidase [Deltaproteobacteria bacterium]|nr:L,D-transpeptidase [Deltaproteobacteria bacterium]
MRTEVATIGLACLLAVGCDRSAANSGAGSADPVAAPTAAPVQPEPAPAAVAPPKPASSETPAAAPAEPTLADIEPELEIPEFPIPPEDYGLLEPVVPPPAAEELVVHALAGFEVVAVHAEPRANSGRLGYLRLGTRLMVTAKVGTDGCPKGWHALPTGGFACVGRGLVVDAKRPPYMQRPPTPPRLDQALPYDYGYVKRWNSPMWWRIPNAEEQKIADERRAVREAKREGKPLPTAAPKPAAPAPTKTADAKADTKPKPAADAKPTADALPSVTDDPTAEPPAPDTPATAAKPPAPAKAEAPPAPAAVAKAPVETPAAVEPPPPVKLPLSPETPWLEKGFFVSLGTKVRDAGKTWWYTSRGGYVDTSHAYQYQTKDFHGVELGTEASFPFGYAMVKSAKQYELGTDGKLTVTGSLERRTFVDLTEEIEIDGKAYMMTVDGSLLRKKDLRLAEPQPLPEGIEPWEGWIDVSLGKQMLIAYEGDRPVYVTLVSTGKKGTVEEPFDTPAGRYRIRSKHVSSTMDGPTVNEGNYSIQDVPWAMFFEGSYALHGAFWHNSFGRVRSHGCVNLGPSDARWLFSWTTPYLPEGWHGVHAHEGSPGTTVIVRE